MTTTVGLWILAAVGAAFQSVAGPHLSVGGVQPEFVILFTVISGLLYGPLIGCSVGFVAGLMQTLQSQDIGYGALVTSRLVAGFIAGHAGRRIYLQNLFVPGLAVLVGTAVCELAYFVVYPYPDFPQWLRIMSAESLYNGILGAVLFPLWSFTVHRRERERVPAS